MVLVYANHATIIKCKNLFFEKTEFILVTLIKSNILEILTVTFLDNFTNFILSFNNNFSHILFHFLRFNRLFKFLLQNSPIILAFLIKVN